MDPMIELVNELRDHFPHPPYEVGYDGSRLWVAKASGREAALPVERLDSPFTVKQLASELKKRFG